MRPWDIWADLLTCEGATIAAARDKVIGEWLKAGDPRPYIDWVINDGHRPNYAVAGLVAHMMSKADAVDLNPTNGTIPFGLAIDRTGAGRPRDLEAETLAMLAGRDAAALMDAGMGGKNADHAVREWLVENGISVSESTVTSARKRFRRQKGN